MARQEFNGTFLPNSEYGYAAIIPKKVRVGSWNTFRITYTAGKKGIPEGSGIQLRYNFHYLEWSPMQVDDPRAQGYVSARALKKSVSLKLNKYLTPWGKSFYYIQIKVAKGRIREGDKIEIVLGDRKFGGPGIKAPTYPRDFMRISVVYGLAIDKCLKMHHENPGHLGGAAHVPAMEIENSPRIEVIPEKAVHVRIYLPSVVRPKESFDATLVFCDRYYNPTRLHSPQKGIFTIGGSAPLRYEAPEGSIRHVIKNLKLSNPGVFRAKTTFAGGEYESNPALCDTKAPRIYWGDMHVHSYFSDGTCMPEDLLVYGRDFACLDFMTIIDHDDNLASPNIQSRGTRCYDKMQALCGLANKYSQENNFIVFQGYEWCGPGGDHNVYSKSLGKLPLYHRRMKEACTTKKFYNCIRRHKGLIIASHPHGGRTDWSYFDKKMEFFAEIASVQAESEYTNPYKIVRDMPENKRNSGFFNPEKIDSHRMLHPKIGAVQKALELGCKIGIIGSSDTHYGAIGRKAPVGQHHNFALAAVNAPELTRGSIWEGLLGRNTYATTQERILLRFNAGAVRMGGEGTSKGSITFRAVVNGTSEIDFVDLVKNNTAVYRVTGNGKKDVTLIYRDCFCIKPFNWYYVRVVQKDGNKAWSSPIWLTGNGKDPLSNRQIN